MICFEPVQVSTALSNYRRPTTIKVATNLTRSCTLLLERGRRRNARMTTSFGGRRIYTSWGVTLFCPARAEHLRSVQISAGAYIFTISWGKIKNLSRLISVLSLHLKFVHNHKSCQNSAATLFSP